MIKGFLHRLCFILPFVFWIVLLADPLGVVYSPQFETPRGMELQVQFWVNVFTRYSINQVIIHDCDHPERIYRVVNLEGVKHSKSLTTEKIKQEKADVRRILRSLASKRPDPDHMTPEEKRVWLLWGKENNQKVYALATHQIRVQGGMKEAFREGIIRSGRYLPIVRQVLLHEGLPEDLAYLCHVESSFHPGARSKSSAVGMWQFTRGTGRQFMTINSRVDERLDPVLSTMSAAKLLKENYTVLKSWPLAVTAYNHGLGGMKRAKTQLRTTDMKKVIDRYKSRSFGFASKNFYAEFLAAVHVAQNAETYFGPLKLDDPIDFQVSPLQESMTLTQIIEEYKIDSKTLVTLNPAFLRPIRRGTHKVHAGYRLRIPKNHPLSKERLILGPAEPENPMFAWHQPEKQEPTLPKTEKAVTQVAVFQDSPEKSALPLVPKPAVGYQFEGDSKALQRQYEYQTLHFEAFCEYLTVRDDRIIVQPEETLGHYAEWLDVPTQTLRRLNGLSYRQNIRIGQRIKLPFHRVSQETFYHRRVDYHHMLVNQYFEKHRVKQAVEHRVERGESLWSVAYQKFDVPVWLVLAYNAWNVPRKLEPGDLIRVPLVERVSPAS